MPHVLYPQVLTASGCAKVWQSNLHPLPFNMPLCPLEQSSFPEPSHYGVLSSQQLLDLLLHPRSLVVLLQKCKTHPILQQKNCQRVGLGNMKRNALFTLFTLHPASESKATRFCVSRRCSLVFSPESRLLKPTRQLDAKRKENNRLSSSAENKRSSRLNTRCSPSILSCKRRWMLSALCVELVWLKTRSISSRISTMRASPGLLHEKRDRHGAQAYCMLSMVLQ